MPERITKRDLHERERNVNRRLNLGKPVTEYVRHVQVEQRNGYCALDEYRGAAAIRTITVGSKREVADFLHAMMVGIDLFRG